MSASNSVIQPQCSCITSVNTNLPDVTASYIVTQPQLTQATYIAPVTQPQLTQATYIGGMMSTTVSQPHVQVSGSSTTTGTTSAHAADVTPNNIGNSTASNTFIATCKASDELGMHISLANKEKIVKGEFIDLASLLKNTNLNVKSVNQTISLVQGELVLQQKQQHQKINNIEQ